MGTTTLLQLDQKLLEAMGDLKQHAVTTALTTSASLISTHLPRYRSSASHFSAGTGWYVYIEDKNNAGESRNISADDGTNTLTVRGGNWTDDGANLATFRLSRSSWEDRSIAINNAVREIYPNLFAPLEDRSLVTGNVLPDNSFEQWTSSTASSFYSTANAALAKTTTAGLIRGILGTASMKVTVSAANGHAYLSSDQYPRLLDLMGKTITFKCWVYPQVADDAFLTIYTIKADGTAQTLNSTTACPAGKWTLLELEDQDINDDIEEIQFRFRVHTDAKYTYFDSARVTGVSTYEYLLLSDFRGGTISQVYIQTSGYSDDPCDDLQPKGWKKVYDWHTIDDATYHYLRLPFGHSDCYQIRVIGYRPLQPMTGTTNALAAAEVINLDGEKLNLLIAYAKYEYYKTHEDVPSSEDIRRYETASAKAYLEYLRLLPSHRMIKPRVSPRLPTL